LQATWNRYYAEVFQNAYFVTTKTSAPRKMHEMQDMSSECKGSHESKMLCKVSDMRKMHDE